MRSYRIFRFCRKAMAFVLLLLLSLSLFSPLILQAEDSERMITLKFSYKQFFGSVENLDYNWTYKLTGKGKFVVCSYRFRHDSSEKDGSYCMRFMVFSDKPFTAEVSSAGGRAGTFSPALVSDYKGIYFTSNGVMGGLSPVYQGQVLSESWSGFANLQVVSSQEDIPSGKAIIDSGTLDLTKDSYKEETDSSGYNKNLDFSYLKGDYKVKYTVEKDSDGKWNFVTPDEAGIQIDWINQKDVDGAYVKITAYGEFYEDIWNASYINTGVTISNINRNSLSYLLKQKELISLAQSGLNKTSGHGFVVKYLYIQSFGVIDGRLCHGRIYKLNSDLVTDYGNADNDGSGILYEQYFPEITVGSSMPPGYTPDPDDPDPEKTEPQPDLKDTTSIITPVTKPGGSVFDTDLDLTKALNSFYDSLKSSMTLLGDFPALIANIFVFLPSSVLTLISLGIFSVIILRFIGR